MTMDQIKQAKAAVEEEILALLQTLEAKTGMRVSVVDPAHDYTTDPQTIKTVRVGLTMP